MSEALRVLLVEDSDEDALLLARALRRGGFDTRVRRVQTPQVMRAALAGGAWDVVIADYVLPGFSAPAALALLKETGRDIPFIVVSGRIGEDDAVEMMRAGAHDYVLKDNLSRLVPAIKRELREAEQRRARKRAERALADSERSYRSIFETAGNLIASVDSKGVIVDCNPRVTEMLGYRREEIVGQPLAKIIHPDCLAAAEQSLRRVLTDGGAHNKECKMVRKDGTAIDVSVNSSALKNAQGRYCRTTCIIDDITERKRAARRIQRQTAVLDAINKVFRETLRCESKQEVARTCLAVAQELTGSKFGFIGEINRAGRFDTVAVSRPAWDACKIPDRDAETMLKNMEIRGIWSVAIRDGRSHIANDPASDPERVGTPKGHPPITSFLGVPLKRASRTIGMIGLANKESGYDSADREDIETLSAAFMEALDRRQAEEAVRTSREQLRSLAAGLQAVREEERTRLARKIHDELGHALAAMKMDLSWLDKRLTHAGHLPPRGAARERMKSIFQLLDATIQSVRQIASDLRPGLLDDLGLAAALEWTARQFESRTGIRCAFTASAAEDTQLDRERSTALYRICQELLTNVVRHAGATAVKVALEQRADQLVLEVRDNGKGITREQASSSASLGILGMRERVFVLGGQLDIAGVPGKGTTATVRIPVGAVEPAEK